MSIRETNKTEELSEILLANAPTEETQQARIAALKGKACLWITSPVVPYMSQQLRSRCEWAIAQGVELIPVFESESDKLHILMKDYGYFKRSVFVDLHSDSAGDLIVESVQKSGYDVHSVFTPYEQCITLVGEVGTKLGLLANPAEAYTIARSKHKTRQVIANYGLATPKSATCCNLDELKQAVEIVGFPLILKPGSGAGSSGVYRADDYAQCEKFFNQIQDEIKSSWALSWNPSVGINKVLIEELLVGPEFDTDILLWDGEPVYVRTVDNWECPPPYFLESGSNMPSLFDRETMIEPLEKYSVDCVKACGFKFGCFHVECIITAEGPRLIEVNARQGGGCMQEFNLEMYGVDIFANFFMSSFGIPINPPVIMPPRCAMADYSFVSKKTGTVKDLDDFMTRVKDVPGLVRYAPFVKPGDKVVGTDTGFPCWLGEFVVKAKTAEECQKIILDFERTVTFNIVNEDEEKLAEKIEAVVVDEKPEGCQAASA